MTTIDELPSRIGHSGVFCNNNGRIYLFGGLINSLVDVKPYYTNDLIEVDISSRKWENKAVQGVGPSARNFHSSCLRKLHDHEEMIVFGGKSNGFHRDIWSYRFDSCDWTLVESKNSEIISPRYGQSTAIYGDCLFVFGGYDNNSFSLNELFVFNFESLEWKLIELNVEIQRRYHHASVLDEETGDWYIYGGKSATDLVGDLVKIKLSTLDQEKGTCESQILISGLDSRFQRFGHSMTLEKTESDKRLISLGGCNKKEDHLDCISFDLNSIEKGWEILYTHSLSYTFKVARQDVGPVFHTNVPFILNKDDEVVSNNFVFGGVYQKTEDANIKRTEPTQTLFTNLVQEGGKNLKFNIQEFDSLVNDDIFRIVLSFLPIPDLCSLQLASKKLRICKLTTEDQYWKDYYYEKIKLLHEASKCVSYNYDKTKGKYDVQNTYSEIYSQYLEFNNNYRGRLIQVIGECMSKADKEHHKLTSHIEGLSQFRKDIYLPQEKILKYKLKSNVSSCNYKIVQVGDGAVGKTCLWIRLTSSTFPEEYVPTVFDNYSKDCHYENKFFSLGLWDTAGPEDYDRLRPLSYPDTDLFFATFSCSSAETSLVNIASKWVPEVLHHCPNAPIALVCTKIDLRNDSEFSRQLLVKKHRKCSSFEQGELLAKKLGLITYMETSARSGAGIDDLPLSIVKCICMWNDPDFKENMKKRSEKKNCELQ